MTPSLSRLGLALWLAAAPVALTSVAPHSAAAQTSDMQLSFVTLDGDAQQINVDEIWRVRAAITRDEPPGAVVINYAYERLFVKEPLDEVVEKIRLRRDIKKFTLPGGGPVYIVAGKVIGVNRPIPQQDHQNAQSVILLREGRQQVRETREAIREALAK